MRINSSQVTMLLIYTLLVASAANVLQWQHYRQVTNTLNAEIARLQKKADMAVMNEIIKK